MMTKCSSVGGNLAPLPLSIVVKSLNSESLEYSLLRVSVMRTVAMEWSILHLECLWWGLLRWKKFLACVDPFPIENH